MGPLTILATIFIPLALSFYTELRKRSQAVVSYLATKLQSYALEYYMCVSNSGDMYIRRS